MRKFSLFALILLITMSNCNNKKEIEKQLTSGIDKANLDVSVSPKEDFYQYACGGWMKMHPLTDEYARYGTFDKLGEDNQLQIKTVITEMAQSKNKQGSIAQKIGDLYNMGMDSVTLNKQGAQPIADKLQQIADIATFADFQAQLTSMHAYGSYPFFGLFGGANPVNSDMTIAYIWQSGLGMGDRDYYLEAESKDLQTAYNAMNSQLFSLSGFDKMIGKQSEDMALAVFNIEHQLAAIFMDRTTLRDPQKTFNYMSVADLQHMLPEINFSEYLKGLSLSIDSVNVGQVDYIKGLSKIFKKVSINDLKCYLAATYIRSAAPYLSDAFVDTHFDFYGKTLSGKIENKPRWKRVVNTVDGSLGEAVGQMYVDKYFPKEAKERMTHLVDNLKLALKERINGNTWMTDATKAKAIEKLDAFRVKIGYPTKWRDYSALTIKNDSYWANLMRASKFETDYELSKINKPVDKDEWQMTPQTVNAYYSPQTNEICFPAAILQPPFFDMNADDAANYGAIGVVIGHEMTHGFDDKGCQYDKNGNLANWWQEEDSKTFEARTKLLVDHFNSIEVYPGIYANGEYTLGENIADNGGLQVSFLAMTKAIENGEIQAEMDGFSAQQRFFLAYANVWANNIRDEEIKKRTKEDPHSLGKWRVNGTLPHVDAFLEAFDIQENDKMYLAPEKRAHIW
ncbi:MAG: M13 family metallopeptidase [Bacteroidales bacterium]|nr:M13 family metallopeptidase [Bacteroidales bacterium]